MGSNAADEKESPDRIKSVDRLLSQMDKGIPGIGTANRMCSSALIRCVFQQTRQPGSESIPRLARRWWRQRVSYPAQGRDGVELFHHRNSIPANRQLSSARRGLCWLMRCSNWSSLVRGIAYFVHLFLRVGQRVSQNPLAPKFPVETTAGNVGSPANTEANGSV